MKFPVYIQHDSMQCGIACLQMICKYYGKEYTLAELSGNDDIDMFTTVFIGNSQTEVINGRLVTPRGYRDV